MASVSRTFTRLAVSFARQTSSRPSPRPCPSRSQSKSISQGQWNNTRHFSVTPFRANEQPPSDEQEDGATSVEDEEPSGPEEEEALDQNLLRDIDSDISTMDRQIPLKFADEGPRARRGFWAQSEDDDHAQVPDEKYEDDAITSMAHAELEEHRELREYARIVAWDMPSLANLAKPFSLPPESHLLRFRYTTYMGESHPAENKVVMELCSSDLTPTYLSEEQRITLLKLVGTRYNPAKDLIKMSCEKFPSRAQNKRFLGDMINSLIKEAKEGDSFKDLPLDLRHHKPKPRFSFPQEWAMTEERKAELEAKREQRKKAQLDRLHVIDGSAVIGEAMEKRFSAPVEAEKVAVPVKGKGKGASKVKRR